MALKVDTVFGSVYNEAMNETATTFDTSKYVNPPAMVIVVDGTAHAQTCEALLTAEAPRLAKFTDGGFDLFCAAQCLDHIISASSNGIMEANAAKGFGSAAGAKAPAAEDDGKEWTPEMVEEWLLGLGRKVEPSEVSKSLARAATEWAKGYTGSFAFMVDMAEAANSRKSGLSVGQAKGTLNCWRAELTRKPKVQKGSGDQELDLSELPAGRYAVPEGDTRLKVLINKPGSRSKWEGWTFVSDAAEYGNRTNYGKQAPGSIYVGEIQTELAKILADPFEASKAYGKLVGSCGVCGRVLEDADSIAKGIGPVCEQKW